MTSSRVCVDASVVVRALVPTDDSELAAALFARWIVDRVEVTAPALLAFEVSSALRRFVSVGELEVPEGDAALEAFLRLPIRTTHRRELVAVAWQFARDLGLTKTYDAAYLAVGRLHDCVVWTADKRLFQKARSADVALRLMEAPG